MLYKNFSTVPNKFRILSEKKIIFYVTVMVSTLLDMFSMLNIFWKTERNHADKLKFTKF